MIRVRTPVASVLALAFLLCACGQKGPLKLPDSSPVAAPAPVPPAPTPPPSAP